MKPKIGSRKSLGAPGKTLIEPPDPISAIFQSFVFSTVTNNRAHIGSNVSSQSAMSKEAPSNDQGATEGRGRNAFSASRSVENGEAYPNRLFCRWKKYPGWGLIKYGS